MFVVTAIEREVARLAVQEVKQSALPFRGFKDSCPGELLTVDEGDQDLDLFTDLGQIILLRRIPDMADMFFVEETKGFVASQKWNERLILHQKLDQGLWPAVHGGEGTEEQNPFPFLAVSQIDRHVRFLFFYLIFAHAQQNKGFYCQRQARVSSAIDMKNVIAKLVQIQIDRCFNTRGDVYD